MTFTALKTALLTVTTKVYHFTPPQTVTGSYIVWAEDSQSASVWADDKMQMQNIQGTVDYYTKIENDANIDLIQSTLNDADISFQLNSVQYERDTGYIHYEWTWQTWPG